MPDPMHGNSLHSSHTLCHHLCKYFSMWNHLELNYMQLLGLAKESLPCSITLNHSARASIKKLTCSQSKSKVWFKFEAGRMTGSWLFCKLYLSAYCAYLIFPKVTCMHSLFCATVCWGEICLSIICLSISICFNQMGTTISYIHIVKCDWRVWSDSHLASTRTFSSRYRYAFGMPLYYLFIYTTCLSTTWLSQHCHITFDASQLVVHRSAIYLKEYELFYIHC